jgi:amidase
MNEIVMLTARGIAAKVRAGELSAAEVVDAHLQRIADVNPGVNAIVDVYDRSARQAAAEADRRQVNGEELGPMHGVPVTVKMNIDVEGEPTTWGVPAFAGQRATLDAPVVERMRAAGAIILGRTNLPDMALRVHTDSSLYGLTRNPWNANRTCGGSSGGEAVSLATGMSAIGLGNDIGGSLRNPATCCGIASIRPSRHRVPDAATTAPGAGGYAVQSLNVQGPMARNLADVRLGLSVIAGTHPRDPSTVPSTAGLGMPARPLRVALLPEPPGGGTDAEVASAVRSSGRVLERHGHHVEEVVPPRYEDALHVWGGVLTGGLAPTFESIWSVLGHDARAFLAGSRAASRRFDLATFCALIEQQRVIAELWAGFFELYDVILSPVWARLPFTVGTDVVNVALVGETFRPVQPANLLGLPSAVTSVAKATTNDGEIPIGVQVIGPWLADERCLATAEIIEAELALVTPIDPR